MIVAIVIAAIDIGRVRHVTRTIRIRRNQKRLLAPARLRIRHAIVRLRRRAPEILNGLPARPGIQPKIIIEAVILLNQNKDVFDLLLG